MAKTSACPDCGGTVSVRADSCPHCGAPLRKPKKQVGTGTGCLVIILVLVGVGWLVGETTPSSISSPASSATSRSSQSRSAIDSSERTPSALPRWSSQESTDAMTGVRSSYASSPAVPAVKPMDFPYNRVTASLHFGCNAESEWIYFAASEAPNITDDETESGYNLIRTRLRWDNEVVDTRLTQTWGERFLHVVSPQREDAIKRVMASSVVRLELNWYGEGRVHFDIPLRGSSAAVAETRARCATFAAG